MRFSPWEPGVYFALGVISADRDLQNILYEEAPRVVGNNAYNDTGLDLELKSKHYTGPAVGMGMNHVFNFGLSLSMGFMMGLKADETPDITVTSFGSDPSSQADLELFKHEVEDEYLEFPPVGMFHLAIGYNF